MSKTHKIEGFDSDKAKKCSVCEERKELNSFHTDKRASDKLRSSCKSCDKIKTKLFGTNSPNDSTRKRLGELVYYTLRIMYGTVCPICGEEMTYIQIGDENYNAPSAVTIDHKIPVEKGGSDNIWNLHLMCRKCNREKNDKIIPEFIPACIIDPDSLEAEEMRLKEKLARQKVYSFFKKLLVNN